MQKTIPDFISKLYAASSAQYEGRLPVENEVQRKLHGIKTLSDTLVKLSLEVVPIEKTKTVNNKTSTHIYIQVRDKALNNKYAGFTLDERIRIDALIANGIGFNLAKAIVKNNGGLDHAMTLDNQVTQEASEAANQDDEKKNKEREEKEISQQFIQAQLDAVFDPAVDINSSIKNNFEGALKNLKEDKNLKKDKSLTFDQEKTLFAFIEHTYGSVVKYLDSSDTAPSADASSYFNLVHEILKELDRENLKKIYYKPALQLETEGDKQGLIDKFKNKKDKISPNEKLALIRAVEKVGIDVSQLNDTTYTNALKEGAAQIYGKIKEVEGLQDLLKFQKSTVTSHDVKAYGKLQLIKQVFDKITKSANEGTVDDLEAQFKILDGQDATYANRLRSPCDDPAISFSNAQKKLLWEHGSDQTQNIGGLDLQSLKVEAYPAVKHTDLTTRPNGGQSESLLNGREYNLKFLEDGHVMGMSELFARRVDTTLNNPYVINAGAAATSENARSQQTKYLEAAMIKVKQGKAAQLFVSDNGHWTTCSLLPLGNNKFIIIGMDSMQRCSNIRDDIVPKLVDFGKKLGLGIEKDGKENFFDMSVAGQQQGFCCGFASACNGFSLQKTYNDFTDTSSLLVQDGNFNKDDFKDTLFSNIVYRRDEDRTVLYNNEQSNIPLKDFVKQFGGLALQKIASNDSMKNHLGEKTVVYIKDTQTCTADQEIVQRVLKDKKLLDAKTTVNEGEIKIQYDNKLYAISQAELTEINDVKYYKGLETLLNGGTLDSFLSDDRKKNIFIKILKDAFAGEKNPYTRSFAEDRKDLKNIVHIDSEIEGKIKAVIKAADNAQGLKIEIDTWDAILLWLYHIPLLGRLVELFGAEVVKCAVEVDKLENTSKSWQKYKHISQSVNTLIIAS